jgi:hypothetical protein
MTYAGVVEKVAKSFATEEVGTADIHKKLEEAGGVALDPSPAYFARKADESRETTAAIEKAIQDGTLVKNDDETYSLAPVPGLEDIQPAVIPENKS